MWSDDLALSIALSGTSFKWVLVWSMMIGPPATAAAGEQTMQRATASTTKRKNLALYKRFKHIPPFYS